MTVNKTEKQLVEAILQSFKREPEDWVVTEYEATHRESGVVVWISNEYYGLHVKIGNKEVMGGVTLPSTFFGALIPWRRKLYDAFEKHRPSRINPVSAVMQAATEVLNG